MIAFIIVEWFLTIVPGVAFLMRFGWPGRHHDPAVSWHVSSWTAVAVIETLGLTALAFHIRLPMWVYAVIYGAGAAVAWWRLWLLLATERRRRGD